MRLNVFQCVIFLHISMIVVLGIVSESQGAHVMISGHWFAAVRQQGIIWNNVQVLGRCLVSPGANELTRLSL